MIKEIVKDKHELSKCCTFRLIDEYDIVRDLMDTAKSHPNCAGLAANQIGFLSRIIVVKIKDKFVPMVSPEFTPLKTNGVTSKKEGCLSFPGQAIKKRRYKKIKVSFFDPINGVMVDEMLLKGMEARVVQHEIDHLNGVLI